VQPLVFTRSENGNAKEVHKLKDPGTVTYGLSVLAVGAEHAIVMEKLAPVTIFVALLASLQVFIVDVYEI